VIELDELLGFWYWPRGANSDGAHAHQFAIPGIVFILVVGKKMAADTLRVSAAPAPECYIGMDESADMEELMKIAELRKTSLRL
jgi:hypothetical protein